MTRQLIRLFIALVLVTAPAFAGAAEADRWGGTWIAEGTLFSIAVIVRENLLHVEEVESLGFQWSAGPGQVSGDTASFQVNYAGATANIRAQLIEPGRARVTASRCMPEFVLVCALIRNQFAIFSRTSATR